MQLIMKVIHNHDLINVQNQHSIRVLASKVEDEMLRNETSTRVFSSMSRDI